MRAPLAACRESEKSYIRLPDVLYVFEHKAQYLSIHAAYTDIVVFRHVGHIPR